ncbi:MAG: Uma2 family endonuclease, partial [Tolypothrix sp. T3-bin4]|nr:Uma2 family endonuclease [Tolypothrix sp. T3-bin4]
MMASTDIKIKLSLAKFLELPETEPASEYVNGIIYQKPMPKGRHSTLQVRLSASINQVYLPQQIAHAFTELRCSFGGRSIVPDITVFDWSRLRLKHEGELKHTFKLTLHWVIKLKKQ